MRKLGVFVIVVFMVGLAVAQVSRQRIAVRELAGRAAGGDAKSLYDLATLHDRGYDSIPVDTARSTTLYRLSAEKGYAPAQNYLGFRYFNGEGVREDVDSALYWLAKAAGAGDAKAANNLGYLLANGEKVTRDYKGALYWLTRAADAGLPAGQSQLADLYRQGLGTPTDTLKAMDLYNSAIAHGLGDAELKLLSMMGRKWKTLPSDSLLTLGRYYYTHRAPFIGVTLFENIIANSSSSQSFSHNHSPLSSDSSHISESPHSPQNPQSSQSYCKGGNDENLATAYALLGDAYSRGYGVPYDHDKSIEYYLLAAIGGNPSAQFVIAELLDLFPDALSPEILSSLSPEILKSLSPEILKSLSPEIITNIGLDSLLPAEVNNASYWYARAASAGVTDADTATRLLLWSD